MNFVTVTTEAAPEVIEADGVAVIYTPDDLQAIEVTAPVEIVTEHWTEAVIVESASQGPPGPPGAAGGSYPAKHLTYANGQLVEVLLFHDTSATMLAEQRVLTYDNGVLTGITYYDVLGVLITTRTFAYTDGVLTSVSDN